MPLLQQCLEDLSAWEQQQAARAATINPACSGVQPTSVAGRELPASPADPSTGVEAPVAWPERCDLGISTIQGTEHAAEGGGGVPAGLFITAVSAAAWSTLAEHGPAEGRPRCVEPAVGVYAASGARASVGGHCPQKRFRVLVAAPGLVSNSLDPATHSLAVEREGDPRPAEAAVGGVVTASVAAAATSDTVATASDAATAASDEVATAFAAPPPPQGSMAAEMELPAGAAPSQSEQPVSGSCVDCARQHCL